MGRLELKPFSYWPIAHVAIKLSRMRNLAPNLAAEIRVATDGAELYNGGPGVHYGTVRDAYAVNITLMCGLGVNAIGANTPTPETEILVVERGSGDGIHSSWSGISGYLDRPDLDDPLGHAMVAELGEEIGVQTDDSLTGFTAHVGRRFAEPRGIDGTIHVIPVALVANRKPDVQPDGIEISAARWIKLGEIAALGAEVSFSPGYLANTLPGVLAAFGIEKPTAYSMMGFDPDSRPAS